MNEKREEYLNELKRNIEECYININRLKKDEKIQRAMINIFEKGIKDIKAVL